MHPAKLLTFPVLATLMLAPVASAAGNGALDRAFNKADINGSQTLDQTEFLALQPRSKSWTDALHRFHAADVDDDSLLTPVEFRASNGGKEGGKASRSETFSLADSDQSGSLDPEEFARTMAQSKPWRKVLREFGRKDRNDDSLLSPQEFGLFLKLP